MALYAIGDLHLSLGEDKPMDIFGGWQGYVSQLEKNWAAVVRPEDTVVLAGDTSWAMRIEHCGPDFAFIEGLPGQKWLLKGNHDYWWTTRAKMEAWVQGQGFSSIGFLHNNFVMAGPAALCGTRGWLYDPQDAHNHKILEREGARLACSLSLAKAGAPCAERIAFLHYPPLWPGARSEALINLLCAHGVKRCFYGHLHGGMVRRAVEGPVGGIHYRLISADALRFSLLKIDML